MGRLRYAGSTLLNGAPLRPHPSKPIESLRRHANAQVVLFVKRVVQPTF